MKRIKRNLITFAIIIICFVLETTLFQRLAFATITPNLLVVVTSSFGFMRGKKEGMFVGFFCGLMTDIFFGLGNLIGFYALIYMIIGYVNGIFHHMFYDEDLKLPIALIAASEFFYGILMYFCLYMLRGKFDFAFYFFRIIMPELVYTLIITLGLYQIILRINRKLEEEEKRSASKFV